MDHADHVALLRGAVGRPAGVWADLGAGSGAFTLALAEMLGPGATIHAVDRDARALAANARRMADDFPATTLLVYRADFTASLPIGDGRLDGLLMANSLHFVRDKGPVLALVRGYLRPGGRLVVVEYDADEGNTWVPYPLSFPTWERLATEAGFVRTARVGRVPSRFLGAIYSAASDLP